MSPSDFKTGKAIQSSPRDLKYHFFSCVAANNHEKGSVVTTHELSSSPESHVIEGGDQVRVCDMVVDVHLAAKSLVNRSGFAGGSNS